MTIQEITQLRKTGQLDAAFDGCRQLLDSKPTDRYFRVAMALTLKPLCERAAGRADVDGFIRLMVILASLHLDEIGETALVNRFAWDVNTLMGKIRNDSAKASLAADALLDVLKTLTFDSTERHYSLLVEAFLKVRSTQGDPWLRFNEFADWWGLGNFLPGDYERVMLKNGRSLPSVAERCYSSYSKVLVARIVSSKAESSQVDGFMALLDALIAGHPEFQFSVYHKTQLLLALGRRADAMEAIRPFVRKRQHEFWVWNTLAQASEDASMSLSCYCRALSCQAEPGFLGKVRLKAALLMHRLGFNDNARREIEDYLAVYRSNGWHVSSDVIEVMRSPSYQNATAPRSNADFYSEHIHESENYLFDGVAETAIIISHINAEKGIANFLTADHRRGFFFTRGLRVPVIADGVMMVRFEGEFDSTRAVRLLSSRSVESSAACDGSLRRRFSGRLRASATGGFGFVDDIYVAPGLMPDAALHVDRLSGEAVLTYNYRREQWGWRAVSVD